MSPPSLVLRALPALPEIAPGVDLGELIWSATRRELPFMAADLVVVAQKIVSKAEGRYIALREVRAGDAAHELAAKVGKDPRVVELILAESRGVVRMRPGVLIVEHRTGHILANAGIDTSNIAQDPEDPGVLLWPEDPDASARRLSADLGRRAGRAVAVIINDSIGRAWRLGTVGHAIGCGGIAPLWNQIGRPDRFGNTLRVTESATADGVAAAAALVQGEAAEGLPVVWVEGGVFEADRHATARQLQRDPAMDLFR